MEKKFFKAFTFTVPNFSQESSRIISPPFSGGGCQWIVNVYLRTVVDNYVSLYLSAYEPKSLGLNWKRRASFYFVLLNQSGKETYRTSENPDDRLFCAETPRLGFSRSFPLEKILQKGVLVNDSFTIEIYIKLLEVVDGNAFVNGFHVLFSQATLVKQIFVDHPDIAKGFKSKNQVVKTEYMNVLLGLLDIVQKPLKSISETELSNAHCELCELTEVGFKLEWLKTKLEEVSLERKKVNTDGYRIQQLEEHVKNLKLTVSGLKVELVKEKTKSTSDVAKVLSLEKTLSDLETELANEKTKSAIATANFGSLKEAFSDLRVELEKEKAKSTSVAAKVLSLEKTLSDLKFEQKKAKSTKVFSWSGLKVKKYHKKGNSEITTNLLSWEDGDDLVSPTDYLEIQQKKYDYKTIN